jgi:Uma2 family endonuclease
MPDAGTDSRSTEQDTSVPPLEAGDHLTREEFERRYHAMPRTIRAELIEGEVHMPSPARWHHHGTPNTDLICWMGTYRAFTPGVEVGLSATIRLDMENEPQPDGAMIITPACGGQSRIDEDDYLVGSPELTGEISASTVSIDLNKKFRVYRRNRVREYIVWRVRDRAIDWFVHRHADFARLDLDASGIYRSEVFPGLWLDAAAMTGGDMAKVLQVLHQGLASPEHTTLITDLHAKRVAAP